MSNKLAKKTKRVSHRCSIMKKAYLFYPIDYLAKKIQESRPDSPQAHKGVNFLCQSIRKDIFKKVIYQFVSFK